MRCVSPELKMALKKLEENTSIKVNDTQKIHKAMIQITAKAHARYADDRIGEQATVGRSPDNPNPHWFD